MRWNQGAVLLIFLAVFAKVSSAQQISKENSFNPFWYLTPISSYSRMGKSLALRYNRELVWMLERVHKELRSERFDIINLGESPKGGAGFWINPAVLSPGARFLGLAVKINIQLPYFPDSESGRLADALDAFGKDLFKIMADTLEQIPEPQVKGIVVVLIYSRAELKDPRFFDDAEASVLFISRYDLKRYHTIPTITLHKLFENADCYYLSGSRQIQTLLQHFIRG